MCKEKIKICFLIKEYLNLYSSLKTEICILPCIIFEVSKLSCVLKLTVSFNSDATYWHGLIFCIQE